jgi:hypothetical protein
VARRKVSKERLNDESKGAGANEKLCSHHFSDPVKDRLIEKLRLITG